MGIKCFEDIEAWKQAHLAVLETCRLTKSFPSDERFCLLQQMRRAAISVPAIIAEGFGRRRRQDKIRFYNYSQSSVDELRYYVRVSKDLGYGTNWDVLWLLLDSAARLLKGLVQKTATLPQFSDS